jgi:hypothetical protein
MMTTTIMISMSVKPLARETELGLVENMRMVLPAW